MASETSTLPASANFFHGASDISFNGPVTATANINQESFDPWGLLYAEVAPNAILNTGGRADPVRCHPGTREEVISKAEGWMVSGYREDRRIFWLSGPAGAGKSAIVQTLAENCIRRREPMANFFFFRGDVTRAHSRPVVATLLYQLFEFFPDTRPIVNRLIAQDRLIFKRSLRDQFAKLLDGPIREIRSGLPNTPPIILLIDGVDECDSRRDLDAATISEQVTLLNVLHEFVTNPNSPFIVLVASRVESHISMTFNIIGCRKDSIYLNDEYQPDSDIRLYITSELGRIKRAHPLGRLLNDSWPSEDVIEVIVKKSSGQFIYAATVARFIANSGQSPAVTMEMVLNVRPAQKHSPFAEVDAIYTFILSRCENWEVVREIIAVDYLFQRSFTVSAPMSSLGYSDHEFASFFSDLTSIIQADIKHEHDTNDLMITFYHASFQDFIYDDRRAGKFHINLTTCANALAPRLILGVSDYYTLLLAAAVLREVDKKTDHLTTTLTHLPPTPKNVNPRRVRKYFYPKINALYAEHDGELYKQICGELDKWAGPPRSDHLISHIDLLRSDSPFCFVDSEADDDDENSPSLGVESSSKVAELSAPNAKPKAKRKIFKWLTRHFR